MKKNEKLLTLKKVSKAFGGIKAVDDCSFEVKKGLITSLIGPNGAGKTTVFNLITGLLKNDEGEIFLDKKMLTGKSPDVISKLGVCRTFQQVRLFDNLSIEENLLFSAGQKGENFLECFFYDREKHDLKEKIDSLLELVGVKKSSSTICRDLSYGQKRLVELARALIRNYDILLLDEPTAGVNPFIRKKLKEVLKKLRKQGKTIFLIEHDMDFVMDVSDEVVVMAEGRTLTHDTPSKVKNDKRVLEAYLGK
jgi:ABC-type branched-subunit amino acid transport system ATPase component